MIREIAQIIRQEIKISFRRGGEALQALGFFAIAITFFPLATSGVEIAELTKHAAAIIWVVALFASTLLLPNLLERDYEDGTLDQWLLCPLMLEWVVLAKTLAYWIASVLPLIILSPLLCLMLGIENITALVLSLAEGTLAICFLGCLGGALLLGNRQKGLLLPLIIFPLIVPVLIFGSAISTPDVALEAKQFGWLFIHGAMLIIMPLCTLLSAVLIRIAVAE